MTPAERFAQFKQLTKTAADVRKPISPQSFNLDAGVDEGEEERKEGDLLVTYVKRSKTATAKLSELVFGDETAGKVYPGALLWADSLSQDGRLDPVFQPKRTTLLNVTVDSAIMKPATPTAYKMDGSFSQFTEILGQIIQNVAVSQPRVNTKMTTITNTQAALLELGISAKGWGASLNATLNTKRETSRSVLIASLEQSYFNLVCTPDPGETFFQADMFENAEYGDMLLEQVASKGEIGLVRRVTYGRRLLLSFVSSESTEKLKSTLNAGFHSVVAGGDLSLTVEQTEILRQTECQLVVVGGKPDDILTSNIFLPATEVMTKLSAYLARGANFDAMTSAAVTMFELQYTYDAASVIKADAINFTEQIRRSQRKGGGPLTLPPIQFRSNHRSKVDGDTEMDSDDWTYTRVRYQMSLAADQRAVVLHVEYDAREGNDDQTFGDTWFKTDDTVEIHRLDAADERTIRSILCAQSGDLTNWYQGEVHGMQSFPPFGALNNVMVGFDEEDDHDLEQMNLVCNVNLQIELAPGPAQNLA